jgi:hypothetical protein
MIQTVSLHVDSRGDHYDNHQTFKPHWDQYPKIYVAPKISFPLLDGNLSKDVWENVDFSDLFDDIRGAKDAPSNDRPNDYCRTRFKALWDDDYLYIGAILESDSETQAHFTKRNSPIYQRDSDFEVFVDPMGSNHNYKELEVNAINTIWNLMLNKPYDDGGDEYSGRIAQPGDDRYYEVNHQKTATKLLKGELNDPNRSATWSIEVALSFKDLLAHTDNKSVEDMMSPREGNMMRINFSRVERQGDINWTWQPQVVWDPKNQRYKGRVAMHLPDSWGYMVFGDKNLLHHDDMDDEAEMGKLGHGTSALPRDPTWPGRLAAMNVYYAQKAFFVEHNGTYAASIEEMGDLLDEAVIKPFQIQIKLEKYGFFAIVSGNPDGSDVSITNDRHLQIVHPSTVQT